MHEPFITWNLFLTAILIPFGLFLLFQAIKRLFVEKDKSHITIEGLKEDKVVNLIELLRMEAHEADSLSKQDRHWIKKEITALGDRLDTLNGSVRSAEGDIRALDSRCDERHRVVKDSLRPFMGA